MADPTHEDGADAGSPDRLVLITGTGRSGTSTVSGTLSHLGLHVPGPYLGANESNPKGFFESQWAVRFHKRLHKRAWINDFDGRPEAVRLVREAVTPAMREELTTFLRENAQETSQLVVKDPRTVWCQGLWAETAAEVGLSIRYISMLRHPAEVLGSRTQYYASGADEERRRYYATCSLARWINSCIVNERETRGSRRTFVRYVDLLGDWRTAMLKVADDLGLDYDTDLRDASHHPVDDFIDPDLRRIQVSWDEVDVPFYLRDLADDIWDCLGRLADADGTDDAASQQLDTLGERYVDMLRDSRAIAHDASEQSVNKAKAAAVREERKRVREEAAAAQAQTPEPSGQPVAAEVPERSLVVRAGRKARRVVSTARQRIRAR